MRTRLRRALSAATFLVIAGCYLTPLVLAAGCAVGRTPDGGIVLGAEVGKLVETANEAIGTATNAALAAVGVTIPGAGGIIALLARSLMRKSAESAAAKALRDGERAGWDEAVGKSPEAARAAAAGGAGAAPAAAVSQ
jgi:hypothetical protein